MTCSTGFLRHSSTKARPGWCTCHQWKVFARPQGAARTEAAQSRAVACSAPRLGWGSGVGTVKGTRTTCHNCLVSAIYSESAPPNKPILNFSCLSFANKHVGLVSAVCSKAAPENLEPAFLEPCRQPLLTPPCSINHLASRARMTKILRPDTKPAAPRPPAAPRSPAPLAPAATP